MNEVRLLRYQEGMKIVDSVGDLAMNQLLNRANYCVLQRFFEEKRPPIADFDHQFFIEVIQELFSSRVAIEKILSGEDLRVMAPENKDPTGADDEA